ncbi:hypothetical protein ACFE04_018405 [Oxalis oulophora]
MANGSAIIFLLLLAITFSQNFLHLQPPTFVVADTDLIRKTCQTTKYYDLCVSCLKSDPRSLEAADAKGLAVIVVGVGFANATATSSYLSSELLCATNDTNLKKVLKQCADKYKYASEALQGSVQNLVSETYDYAYMNVMAAQDYPRACHNAFKRSPGLLAYPVELGKREDALKRICDVVLGIIDKLA